LGPTRGYQRSDQDFYEDTEHPKELWVRTLSPRDLRVLRQTHWPETLRAPDAHPPPPACPVPTPALDSLDGHFQHSIPDPRDARGRRHALCSLLTLIALAVGAGCHGAQALAEFARSLNHPQRGGRGAADSLPLYEKRTMRRPRTLLDRFTARAAYATRPARESRWRRGPISSALRWNSARDGLEAPFSRDLIASAASPMGSWAPRLTSE
jgi:hypothetical protein